MYCQSKNMPDFHNFEGELKPVTSTDEIFCLAIEAKSKTQMSRISQIFSSPTYIVNIENLDQVKNPRFSNICLVNIEN